jgi:hypothetical protein
MRCWVPSTLSKLEVTEVLEQSSGGRWQQMLSDLDDAKVLPPAQATSREMAQFRTEMLVPPKVGALMNCEWEMGPNNNSDIPMTPECDGDGDCVTLTLHISRSTDDGVGQWSWDVTISWCNDDSHSGGGGEMYCDSFECLDDIEPPFTYDCSGTYVASEKDQIRQQYVDSSLTAVPDCDDLLYRPAIANLFDWSVVQSHAVGSYYDPYFSYAVLRPAIHLGLVNLRADTAFTITTANRIYSTPHHNNLVRCYQEPQYITLRLDRTGQVRCRPGVTDVRLNSRHVYGDAADIHVPNEAHWINLRNKAYALNPRPCREPYDWSPSHLHLDWRAASGALAPFASCPASFVINPP